MQIVGTESHMQRAAGSRRSRADVIHPLLPCVGQGSRLQYL